MSAIGAETTLNLPACPEIGNRAVEAIHAAYDDYHRGFEEITRRARERFERRDWLGAQADATERLALYRTHVDGAVADVHDILQDAVMERTLWAAMRARHAVGARRRLDAELAQTFFNSVTRRVFSTVGVDAAIEYLDPTVPAADPGGPPLFDRDRVEAVDAALVRRILDRFEWSVPYASPERDAATVARLIGEALAGIPARGPIELAVVRSVFFRNKGAYLVGRIRRGDVTLPLVLPLLRAERGIVVDAVLLTPNEASVVFGFSWSYFRVDVPRPRELVEFLSSIMPFKRVDELYNGIGYNKHG
jgi:isocitrate dehydrogenase kinase/phosphatase